MIITMLILTFKILISCIVISNRIYVNGKKYQAGVYVEKCLYMRIE